MVWPCFIVPKHCTVVFLMKCQCRSKFKSNGWLDYTRTDRSKLFHHSRHSTSLQFCADRPTISAVNCGRFFFRPTPGGGGGGSGIAHFIQRVHSIIGMYLIDKIREINKASRRGITDGDSKK